MRKIQFDTRQFIKNVAVIAIPIALTMVDTIMLAPLGERTIGAVGLCAQFASLLFSCYWGFVGGGMLFFAQYWGARDDEGIEKAYGITLTCMMAVASVFTVLALFFPNVIMSLYTDKKNLHSIGISYLMIDGFAYIPQVYAAFWRNIFCVYQCSSELFADIREIWPAPDGCQGSSSRICCLLFGKCGSHLVFCDKKRISLSFLCKKAFSMG